MVWSPDNESESCKLPLRFILQVAPEADNAFPFEDILTVPLSRPAFLAAFELEFAATISLKGNVLDIWLSRRVIDTDAADNFIFRDI